MNIVKFYLKDAAKDPDVVLELAAGEYQEIIVIGWDKKGTLDVRSSLGLSRMEILWLIEKTKNYILENNKG